MTVAVKPVGKSWPLFLLAALSLIPGLGVLFGFAVACWGLVTDRPRGLLAAALGGAGAILNIAVFAVLGYSSLKKNSRYEGLAGGMARVELDSLAVYLSLYHQSHGRYPEALTDLPAPKNPVRVLPLIDHSTSLFNTTTQYQYRASADAQQYHLAGAGPDGVADTPDDMIPSARRTAADSLADEAEDSTSVEDSAGND